MINFKAILCIIIFLIKTTTLTSQDIQVTQISDDVIILHPQQVQNLEVVREVGATITAVRTDSGIIVVDSFVSIEAAEMARKLIRKHFPTGPFKYLICTHHHADHVRGNQCFKDACIIGEVVTDEPGLVFMKTRIGGDRIVDMLTGEQFPRIC